MITLAYHLQSQTLAHTHTCSIDPAIVGCTGRRLLLESSGVQPSLSILCPPWCETRPLEAHFQNREQPKVTRSEMQRVRWLGDDRNAFLGEELLHNNRCVARCVIVMQKPHGTNFALTSLIFKSLGKIAWMDPWEMPASCSNSTIVILLSHWISCRIFSISGIPGTFWLPYVFDLQALSVPSSSIFLRKVQVAPLAMPGALRCWMNSCLSTQPSTYLSIRPSSHPPSYPGTRYITRHPTLLIVQSSNYTLQSHKHPSTHVTTDAYVMLQSHSHFPSLQPKNVPRICLLSVSHATKGSSVIFFTTDDKCPGNEKALVPSRRLTWIVFSLPAGRRIL